MVHTAVGYARMSDRLRAFACTTSIGPGATNLVTGAAVATTNRIPVLLLPGDVFATRRANPVLQELEDPTGLDVSVNDCLRPVSRYFDRVWRPEQLPQRAAHAMRVLTDPAETGAVTLALPQDVATEAFDVPDDLLAPRVWRVRRPPAEPRADSTRLAAMVRAARRPLIVAGGGVIYSDATAALARSPTRPGSRSPRPRPARARCASTTRRASARVGATGTTAANEVARDADLVIGVGTRWSDFTTASRSAFQDPTCASSTSTSTPFDTAKLGALADRRRRPRRARGAGRAPDRLAGRRGLRGAVPRAAPRSGTPPSTRPTPSATRRSPRPRSSARSRRRPSDRDVVVGAAGSLPGDLHKLWRTRDPKGYHVEYAYSCMGYEIAAGLGREDGRPDARGLRHGRRRLVPDDELRARHRACRGRQAHRRPGRQPRLRVHRDPLASRSGVERFGTRVPLPRRATGLDGDTLPVDLAANAASLGARVIRAVDPRRARRGARRGARRHRDHRRASSRPTRWSPRRTPRRGGTCRSPRSRRATRRARRASATRPSARASDRPLSPTPEPPGSA